jgi:hypothetical protein
MWGLKLTATTTSAELAIFRRRNEVISWSPTRKAEEEIVAPSGSIRAKIALHLNHPTFTTNHAIDGEVCDPTNRCMGLVIGKGFSKDNAFWFDHFSRREKKSDAVSHYSAVTEACHKTDVSSYEPTPVPKSR